MVTNIKKVFLFLAISVFAISCNKESDIQEDPIPEFDGRHLIQGGKIYINLYAPKGMKYAPVAKEELPDFITKSEDMMKWIDVSILFEGEYKGEPSYWMHYFGSSYLVPERLNQDGKLMDIGSSFKEIDYTKLTCIYLGDYYCW